MMATDCTDNKYNTLTHELLLKKEPTQNNPYNQWLNYFPAE